MKPRFKTMLASIILFFFVYDVQLKGMPSYLSSRKWSLALLMILSLFHFKDYTRPYLRIQSVPNELKPIYSRYLIIILFVWIYSFFLAVIQGRLGDGEAAVDFKNLMYFILFSVIAPIFIQSLFDNKKDFFNALVFVGIIQSTIVYMLFILEPLRVFFDRIFQTDARFGYVSKNIKVLGLGSGGAALSVLLFLSMFSACYFIQKDLEIFRSILSFFYILVASFFTGRTGFFAGILLFAIVIWKKIKRTVRIQNIIKISGLLLILILLLPFVWRYLSASESLISKVTALLSHLALDETLNTKSDASFLYVISKMNLPDISIELLYGSGHGRGVSITGINVQNDIGYVQRLFSLGIIVGATFYFCNWRFWRKVGSVFYDSRFRKYYMLMVYALFIFELKESFFYYYLVPSFITILGMIEVKEERSYELQNELPNEKYNVRYNSGFQERSIGVGSIS